MRVDSFLYRSQNYCFKFVAFYIIVNPVSMFLLAFLNLRGRKVSSVNSKTELSKIKAELNTMRSKFCFDH